MSSKNARKYLEHDLIQKSGKKDMVVTVPGKVWQYIPMPLSSVWTVQAIWPSDHCLWKLPAVTYPR